MTRATEPELLRILQVGHDASIRGEGLSLRDALKRCRYRELREHITATDLIPILKRKPELVEQWLMWCDDKRTDGGWFLTNSGEIGRISSPERVRYRSLPEAVAEYVIRELDYWA